jgi:hypothetical protein
LNLPKSLDFFGTAFSLGTQKSSPVTLALVLILPVFRYCISMPPVCRVNQKMKRTPETSRHTSVRQRVQHAKRQGQLAARRGVHHLDNLAALPAGAGYRVLQDGRQTRDSNCKSEWRNALRCE